MGEDKVHWFLPGYSGSDIEQTLTQPQASSPSSSSNDIATTARGDDDDASAAGAVYVLLMNSDATVNETVKITEGQGGFGETLEALDFFGTCVGGPPRYDLCSFNCVTVKNHRHKDIINRFRDLFYWQSVEQKEERERMLIAKVECQKCMLVQGCHFRKKGLNETRAEEEKKSS